MEEKGLLITEEEERAIDENGLTVDIIKRASGQDATHDVYNNPLLNSARRKIIAQNTLDVTLSKRLISEEITLLNTIQTLSIEITSFDNERWTLAYSQDDRARYEQEHRDRIAKLCMLYKQMGITMTYIPHETGK
ncbi:MAG: hypothetical protein HGA67_01305 [Candidatus Yonathbacteria bacterium]|nr:hypothetical protein [Candidatus Yonathbacteria bacterium]